MFLPQSDLNCMTIYALALTVCVALIDFIGSDDLQAAWTFVRFETQICKHVVACEIVRNSSYREMLRSRPDRVV